MKNVKKVAIGFLLVVFCAGLVVPAEAAPLRFSFSGQSRPDHAATIMMEGAAREIYERTEGRVEITVFPASQLGNWAQVYENLIRGTVDMALMSLSADFDPRFGVLYVNGIVLDYEQVTAVFHPDAWLTQKLNEMSLDLGVRIIGNFVEGFISLGSTQPLIEPLNPNVDKGVMTRVPNMEVFITGAEAMGFRTITVPWPDVFHAVQTGIAEAVIGMAPASAYTMLGDVLNYWYALNYSIESFVFMVSESSWRQLTPEDQEVFLDVGRRVTLDSIRDAQRMDEHYMARMAERGITVHRFTAEELQPIREALVASWELLVPSMGQDFIDEFTRELGGF